MPSPTIFTTFANFLSGKSGDEKCSDDDIFCQVAQVQQSVDFFIRDAQIKLHTELTKNFTCQIPWLPNADIFANNGSIDVAVDIRNNNILNTTPLTTHNIYIDGPFTANLRDPNILLNHGKLYLKNDNDGDTETSILNEKLPAWLKDEQENLFTNLKDLVDGFIKHQQIQTWLINHGLMFPSNMPSLDEIITKVSKLCHIYDSNDRINISNNLFNHTQFTLDLKDIAFVKIPGGLDLTESKLKVNLGFNQLRTDILKQPYLHIEDFLIHLEPDATSTTPPNAALPLAVTIKPSANTIVIGDAPNPLFILNPGIHIKFIPLRNTWQINAAIDIEIKWKNISFITTLVINAEFFMLGDEIYAEKDHLYIAFKDSQIYNKNTPLISNLNIEITDHALLGNIPANYYSQVSAQQPGANLFANIYSEVDLTKNPPNVPTNDLTPSLDQNKKSKKAGKATPILQPVSKNKPNQNTFETEHIFGLLTASVPDTDLWENGGFRHQAWKVKDLFNATLFGGFIYESLNHYLNTKIQFTPFNNNLETSPIANYSQANLLSIHTDIEYHNALNNLDVFATGLSIHLGLATNGATDRSYSVNIYNDQLTMLNLIPPVPIPDETDPKNHVPQVSDLILNNLSLALLIQSINAAEDQIKIVLNQAEINANQHRENSGLLQGPVHFRISDPEGYPLAININTKQKILNFTDLDMAFSIQGIQTSGLRKHGIYAGLDAKLNGTCKDFNYNPNIFEGACKLHLTSNEKVVYDKNNQIKLQYDNLDRPYAVVEATHANKAYNPVEGVFYFTNQDNQLVAPPIISFIDWSSDKIGGLGKITLPETDGTLKEYFTGWMDGSFNATIIGSTLAFENIGQQFNMFINFTFPHNRLYIPLPILFPRAVGIRAQEYYEAVYQETTGEAVFLRDIYRQFITTEETP